MKLIKHRRFSNLTQINSMALRHELDKFKRRDKMISKISRRRPRNQTFITLKGKQL